MNVEKSLIELLLDEKPDLEKLQCHPFIQSLWQVLLVQVSDYELIHRLKDQILYWILVSRWTFLELLEVQRGKARDPIREKALENANHKAFEKALTHEIRLVGPDEADRLFLPLRRGARDAFGDSQSTYAAIRRIEEARKKNPGGSRKLNRGRKKGRQKCS